MAKDVSNIPLEALVSTEKNMYELTKRRYSSSQTDQHCGFG